VLDLLYRNGVLRLAARKHVPNWNPLMAREIAAQVLDSDPKIDGVPAANDGIAGALLEELRTRGLSGRVSVTGMDATIEGLRAILRGEQCMSVYKPIKHEAEAAALLALAITKGNPPAADDLATANVRDDADRRDVKSVLLGPELANRRTIATMVSDGAVRSRQLCAGDYLKLCRQNGIVTGQGN
jgi:D-xylose transport system substrate-binding protein